VAVSTPLVAAILAFVVLDIFAIVFGLSFVRANRAARETADGQIEVAGKPVKSLSRRDFFRRSLLTSLVVFGAQFGGATIAFLWPNLKGGFGSQITLGDTPSSLLDQITAGQQPFYFGAGRFYLIAYDGDGDKAGGPYEGLTAEVQGFSQRLMALYQKCAHLGCRVPFCGQSQWFECPCHGSKYNYAGEYQLGPAPNGLQRFPVVVDGAEVKVNTGAPTAGPPRGTDTIHQPPQGPFCVG
jgi:cytochrome b6-f complex iron-sulfur subunit